MSNLASAEEATRRVAQRLRQESRTIATEWLERLHAFLAVEKRDVFPSHQLLDHIPQLIQAVADYLETPQAEDISANTLVTRKAMELGELRYDQQASVHQLLREYQMLGELMDAFVEREVAEVSDVDGAVAVQLMRRLNAAIRVLQQQTVDTFVARYTATIERQTAQLRTFSRLVSHEIRQPLGVLQVIAKALPVEAGDVDSARMIDIFNRNIVRLADVTGKLERLARITRATDLSPSEQRVDLTVLATTVANQLADMAAARQVEVRVQPNLPVLRLDPGRAELVFINLIANGIKYSDPAKPHRFVDVYGTASDEPSVIVRDNGVGMASDHLQNVFREFVRAHAQRDDEVATRGLGLGLSIVRECMDAANGSVRVESLPGKGTTFKLTWTPH